MILTKYANLQNKSASLNIAPWHVDNTWANLMYSVYAYTFYILDFITPPGAHTH